MTSYRMRNSGRGPRTSLRLLYDVTRDEVQIFKHVETTVWRVHVYICIHISFPYEAVDYHEHHII